MLLHSLCQYLNLYSKSKHTYLWYITVFAKVYFRKLILLLRRVSLPIIWLRTFRILMLHWKPWKALIFRFTNIKVKVLFSSVGSICMQTLVHMCSLQHYYVFCCKLRQISSPADGQSNVTLQGNNLCVSGGIKRGNLSVKKLWKSLKLKLG